MLQCLSPTLSDLKPVPEFLAVGHRPDSIRMRFTQGRRNDVTINIIINMGKGNIEHWNGPAAELAYGLYNKFLKEVEPLLNIVHLAGRFFEQY